MKSARTQMIADHLRCGEVNKQEKEKEGFYSTVVHFITACGQKRSKLMQRCHKLIFRFLANGHVRTLIKVIMQ